MKGDTVLLKFIMKRLGYTVFVLFGVSILTFGLLKLTPGSPARLMLSDDATEEQIREKEIEMGLDKPLTVQYFSYITGVVRGDLGNSLFYKMPNSTLIFQRLPATAYLTLVAMGIALLISIPMGIIAGVKRGSVIDLFAMIFALLGQSISGVVLGLIFILFFAVKLGWLPAMGYGGFAFVIMPATSLAMQMAALITRMLRSGMVDVLQEDYITATFAKGISNREITMKYALRNAILPVITVVGLQVGTFLGGAVVTEQIFGWPGIGTLTVQAIGLRDFPLVQSVLLVISACFVLVNLLVDIIYTIVDPRMDFN
ncbi:peptide/nickel transport system permease protein [[Clostridium] celerecrescens 18A]|uniref:Peptide/nickel transport system permease protein n=2 Tax=Lacrimispora TaxID=2719231 RepID=A0A2M8Z7J2_9FIRM|nr:peptide/nickel transport system permease protein [[Clostridium] celerecrescens 18A]